MKMLITINFRVTRTRKAPNAAGKSRAKAKPEEPVILTLSSDDEEGDTCKNESLLKDESESSRDLEPDIVDDVVPVGKL